MPKQQTIDHIVAQLLQQFSSVTDETLSRTTGFTMQQVALARYRAQKSTRSVQAPQQALARHNATSQDVAARCRRAVCAGSIISERGAKAMRNWDAHFMRRAAVAAEMATCPRASVGVVLVRDKHELCSGFNGAARGLSHCTDVGCLMIDGHCQRAVHAEANAIIQAALHGVSTAGSTAYITHAPCLTCTKMLINAGIQRIVYGVAYRVSDESLLFLQEANVRYERI